jgi:ribosomal protein S18 acetylase RimI-like enzyme
MEARDPEWIHWVRWCNEGLPDESIDQLILALLDLEEQSRYRHPILVAHHVENNHQAAGYLSLYPGSLGVIGNLRVQAFQPQAPVDRELELTLLFQIIKSLCEQAVDQGIEIVQAISSVDLDAIESQKDSANSLPSVGSDTCIQDRAFLAARVMPLAKLVQMEHTKLDSWQSIPGRMKESDDPVLTFADHTCLTTDQWQSLIETTYVETRDVPELNGIRSITSTLEGYASILDGSPRSWWVVMHAGQPMGCLLLSPCGNNCELTYLGFVPEYRGRGLSRRIMEHALVWCRKSGIDKMTLAVDTRNVPAIRLYQAFGFIPTRFVQAWIYSPRLTKGS